jgi:hypothetical protein
MRCMCDFWGFEGLLPPEPLSAHALGSWVPKGGCLIKDNGHCEFWCVLGKNLAGNGLSSSFIRCELLVEAGFPF